MAQFYSRDWIDVSETKVRGKRYRAEFDPDTRISALFAWKDNRWQYVDDYPSNLAAFAAVTR